VEGGGQKLWESGSRDFFGTDNSRTRRQAAASAILSLRKKRGGQKEGDEGFVEQKIRPELVRPLSLRESFRWEKRIWGGRRQRKSRRP